MSLAFLTPLLEAAPPLLAGFSLTANVAQYWYGRSRRSAIDKQGAIRAPLASVIAVMPAITTRPAASDWLGLFTRTEALLVALRQLDSALIGARGAPLAVVLTVTRLILAGDAVLRWESEFGRLLGARTRLPETEYKRWRYRDAAEADLEDLRRSLSQGHDALRSYMALLNA